MIFRKLLYCMFLLVSAVLGTVCTAAQSTASFTLQVSTKTPTFRVGEVVRIAITQTDVSNHPVSCDYAGGNAVNLIYDYHVTQEDGSPAEKVVWSKPVPPPYSYKQCAIGPGESSTDPIYLNNVYKFDKPGQYTVWVSRVDPDIEDESGKPLIVKSNTITITVLPADATPPAKN